MVSDQGWKQKMEEKYWQEEDQKEERNLVFLMNLKPSSAFRKK